MSNINQFIAYSAMLKNIKKALFLSIVLVSYSTLCFMFEPSTLTTLVENVDKNQEIAEKLLQVADTPAGQIIKDHLIYHRKMDIWHELNISKIAHYDTKHVHASSVTSTRLTPEGKWISIRSLFGVSVVVIVENTAVINYLVGQDEHVRAADITPDISWAITTSFNCAKLWHLSGSTTAAYKALSGHSLDISSVAITPDAQWAITGSYDCTARVWDLSDKSNPQFIELQGHTKAISSVGITPDGKWAITGSHDQTARVWNLFDKINPKATVLLGHTQPINAVGITPDGIHAITGSRDETIRVWNLLNKNNLVLYTPKARTLCVGITPNGRYAITGSSDNIARVWDLSDKTGNTVIKLGHHQNCINSVYITPDCKWAVTHSEEETIKWNLEYGLANKTLADLINILVL